MDSGSVKITDAKFAFHPAIPLTGETSPLTVVVTLAAEVRADAADPANRLHHRDEAYGALKQALASYVATFF